MCKSITKREEWFNASLPILDDMVFKPAGYSIPDNIQIGVGTMGSGREKAIGKCWSSSSCKNGTIQIFISPHIDGSEFLSLSHRVLDVLCHEIVHAIDGNQNGHKAPFRKIAIAIGLEGKMTATIGGDRLNALLSDIIKQIGEYPHATLTPARQKKQTTRMIKAECEDPTCGWSFRASAKNMGMITNHECLACGSYIQIN
tara:strand:- start:1046 stop:1645 length:600 start_codon:yes stop_codon:yes gene_type:complete